jgi:transposase
MSVVIRKDISTDKIYQKARSVKIWYQVWNLDNLVQAREAQNSPELNPVEQVWDYLRSNYSLIVAIIQLNVYLMPVVKPGIYFHPNQR